MDILVNFSLSRVDTDGSFLLPPLLNGSPPLFFVMIELVLWIELGLYGLIGAYERASTCAIPLHIKNLFYYVDCLPYRDWGRAGPSD